MDKSAIIGLVIPFIGTTLGSAMVYFMKDQLNKLLEKILLGFAGGVMMAAAVWSLLIPAMELSKDWGKLAFVPSVIGFSLGILMLLVVDQLVPHLHLETTTPEGRPSHLKKTTMMILAVTIHNFPEGMAVGVVFAATAAAHSVMSVSAAFALALGIAIQNFPEGAIISMPLRAEGVSKNKAFVMGTLSGIVEPIGGALVILLAHIMLPWIPYFLSFAAGAMVYVVVEELIPEASVGEHSNIATIGFAVGFALMMILDVALG